MGPEATIQKNNSGIFTQGRYNQLSCIIIVPVIIITYIENWNYVAFAVSTNERFKGVKYFPFVKIIIEKLLKLS